MARRTVRVRRACAALALALVAPAASPARAQTPPPAAIDAPVRLVPLGAEPIRVRGLHAFLGTVVLDRAPDGLVVVNELPLERYLLGLQEVPLDWPMEALRAQAVAARTYALWTLARAPAGIAAAYGFDICASDECQVFSGADVVASPDGDRWRRAVRSTAGRIVVYDGGPILARYHSTSGGRTLANGEAFPGEPGLPYLRSVPSPHEQGSPVFRWTVRFDLADLQALLRAAGWWPESHGRLRAVHTVGDPAGAHNPLVVMTGRGVVRRTAEELRDMLRDAAPRALPDLYPSPAPTASGRLPETLPSDRFTVRTRAGTVEFVGRGWGHGVGMSQWGAHGMALRGADHRAILRHYYAGTSLARVSQATSVAVGVDWARDSASVFGAFRVEDGSGETIVAEALGTWRFRSTRSDGVAVDAPASFGRPPDVSLVRAPKRMRAGATRSLIVDLGAPARVEVRRRGARAQIVTRDAGRARVPWRAPARPGRYRIHVRAASGSEVRRSEAVAVVVTAAPSERSPAQVGAPDAWWVTLLLWMAGAAFIAVLALGCASFVGTMRR